MIAMVLIVCGLCLGSFVNAVVWRLHEQDTSKKLSKKRRSDLSISRGRSMCPNCGHQLAGKDLVPVLSWVSLGGKCRYCTKKISIQYPLVELATAALYIVSYTWWPVDIAGWQIAAFGVWLLLLVSFMALLVYDLKWYLLPNRIIYPAGALAILFLLTQVFAAPSPVHVLINTFLAVVVGGGIFYAIFQLSDGKWIGGGDVKLGWLLGLVVGTPSRSLLLIFLAAFAGSLLSLPLLLTGKLKRTTVIPFGPFLILGAIITQLFGGDLLRWYQHTFLMVGY